MKPRHTAPRLLLRDATRSGPAARTGPKTVARAAPSPARVRVGREVAGRGGKGVSVISGLPLDEAQLAELATRLKRLCGAGGGVREGVIEIQGEHRERLVAELCKLGYQARRAGG
ncbi:MAG TPA: stress response translation initiation inhibitor YciH [Steroidobacteraceae bacterium]